jgi:hypothetical protein
METKQDVMNSISDHLKIPYFQCSTGSTEPKEFLLAISEQMGIANLTLGLDKIDLAKLIVESSGKKWLPSYDSSGGTITKDGMVAIQESIFDLI